MTHNETMRHLRAAVAGNYAIPTGTRHEHYPVTPLFQDVIASIELLESQNRQLVMRLDEVLGTPCEQVRCQQEIERLREALAHYATDETADGWVAIAALNKKTAP
jgi:hypothetical protein